MATKAAKAKTKGSFWKMGESYFIRTVTHYYTGRLVAIDAQELVLVDVAWIADTKRFAESLRTGAFNEVEPYPDGEAVLVGRGAIIDACRWPHPLPREQQ